MEKQDDSDMSLVLDATRVVQAGNGGLFVSPGRGGHARRVIDSYELIVGRRGVLHMEEAGRPLTVQPGEALILWPGREHCGTRAYTADLSFYWVHFLLPRGRCGERHIVVAQHTRVGEPERATSLLHRFLDEQQNPMGDATVRDLLVTLILCEIARATGRRPGGSASADLAHRALSYIQANHCRAISTADVAESLGVSADHLGRVFRRAHGATIVEVVHRHRLRTAKRLLLDSGLSIEQVAGQCGYGDAGYLRRMFRRREGLTPSRFRRLHGRSHVNIW